MVATLALEDLTGSPQSNGSPTSNHRPEVDYRFSRCREVRDRVLHVLRQNHLHAKRARRLELCGAHATVWQSESTGTLKVAAYHCGMRCCPRCREGHARRTKDRLTRFMEATPLNERALITLTVRSTSAPLSAQIDHLYASFKRLRKSEVWQTARPSGYAVLELTLNTDTGLWHPHLHLLARTRYMPWKTLVNEWLKATNGSRGVDIRRVNSQSCANVVQYLSTYLTKPPQEAVHSRDDRLTEWVDDMMHRKVLFRFGKPKLADKVDEPDTDPADWLLVGTLAGIIRHARLGVPIAEQYLRQLTRAATTREYRDPEAGADYRLRPGIKPVPGVALF